MHTRKRLARALTLAAAGLSLATAVATVGPRGDVTHDQVSVESASTAPPQWGVYTAAGARDVAGAAVFASYAGAPVGRVLDFLSPASWLEMTRNAWLITPYTGSGYQIMLSVPMLPNTSDVSLWRCAAGQYDSHWTSIARTLVANGEPETEIRPGWEFNGNWYKWSARGQVHAYIGCYQRMVTAMRAVAGSRFSFTWNPNLGGGSFPAEQAWPGSAYVDDVSVDVYDTSWNNYPTPAGKTTAQAQQAAFNWIKGGDHGLDFWSAFALAHGKPLGITEWGLTWRMDGHGGGDDPIFVDGMLDFMLNPANHVAYADYFNSVDTPTNKHNVTLTGTAFPLAAARLQARMAGLVTSG